MDKKSANPMKIPIVFHKILKSVFLPKMGSYLQIVPIRKLKMDHLEIKVKIKA